MTDYLPDTKSTLLIKTSQSTLSGSREPRRVPVLSLKVKEVFSRSRRIGKAKVVKPMEVSGGAVVIRRSWPILVLALAIVANTAMAQITLQLPTYQANEPGFGDSIISSTRRWAASASGHQR